MDLEKNLKSLEELVEKMKNASLEEGIKLFEKGVGLTKECMEQLKEYKGKLSEIKSEMDALLND